MRSGDGCSYSGRVSITALGWPAMPAYADPTAPPAGPTGSSGHPAGSSGNPTGSSEHRSGGPGDLRRRDVTDLVDRFGRVARDLRLSVTDRCSLRCRYCMPAEGVDLRPRAELLTAAELGRLARIAVERLGVRRVRVTGGEPLVRRDLERIVADLAALRPRPEIALTTNAVGLAGRARALAAAGLDRVTVSLDTLSRERFAELTRRDRLDDVLAGLRAAAALWPATTKLNAVAMPETLDEARALLRFAISIGAQLRFIEAMPLDGQHEWTRERVVTASQLIDELAVEFALTPAADPRGSAPADLWDVDGGPHRVGIVAAVSRPFCADCDRTRLTADGAVRSCLFALDETDLRTPLRAGASDAELADTWRAAMWGKQAGHGIGSATFRQPDRPMSAIGG